MRIGQLPGEGVRRQRREVCFWSLQTPTLFKTKSVHFVTLLRSRDLFWGPKYNTLLENISLFFLNLESMTFSSYKKDHINYVDPTIFAFLFLLLGSSFTISSFQNVWKFFSPVSAIFSSSTKTAELTQLCTQDFSVAIPCSVNHLPSTSFYWILQTTHKFGQCWLILKNWPVYFSQSETKQYLEWMILNEIYCYLSKWLWS